MRTGISSAVCTQDLLLVMLENELCTGLSIDALWTQMLVICGPAACSPGLLKKIMPTD
jgi:hypothetical protein